MYPLPYPTYLYPNLGGPCCTHCHAILEGLCVQTGDELGLLKHRSMKVLLSIYSWVQHKPGIYLCSYLKFILTRHILDLHANSHEVSILPFWENYYFTSKGWFEQNKLLGYLDFVFCALCRLRVKSNDWMQIHISKLWIMCEKVMLPWDDTPTWTAHASTLQILKRKWHVCQACMSYMRPARYNFTIGMPMLHRSYDRPSH